MNALKRLLPPRVRAELRALRNIARYARSEWELAWARSRPTGGAVRFLGYRLRIADSMGFYSSYKDEFLRRIYDFESSRPRPLVIDGGSSIGVSILYFKHRYPQARVIGFEPDPELFRLLSENVEQNRLRDVTLVNAGLAGEAGTLPFAPGASLEGRLLSSDTPKPESGHGESVAVPVHCLSGYIEEEVDFIKLNIEGQELPVLREVEARGKLALVRELVLEYHGWGGQDQRLAAILELLDRNRFRYRVHDFDEETGRASWPPFRRDAQRTWFCLVHAFRE